MDKNRKKNLIILLAFIILNLISHVYVASSEEGILLNWYLTDDAFYYFKTAQNIAEGKGITFDGIAFTNGFHPVWMIICIPIFALAKGNLYLPLRILIIVQGLLNALSGYLIFRILADKFPWKFGLLPALFWMFLPSIHAVTTKLGLESGINSVSIFLFIFSVTRLDFSNRNNRKSLQTLTTVSLAAILCLFTRLDNVFIVMITGFWLVFHDNQIRSFANIDFFLIIISSLASYFLRIQITDNILNFLPFAYILITINLIVKPVAIYFFSGYDLKRYQNIKILIKQMVIAITIASVLVAIIVFLLFDEFKLFKGYSRSVLVLDYLLSLILLVGVRIIRYKKASRMGFSDEDTKLKDNWLKWISRAFVYFIPLSLSLVMYMTFNQIYAGSAMPVSGKIKHWWGTLPNTIYGQPIKTLAGVLKSLFDPSKETGPFWIVTHPIHDYSVRILKILRFSTSSSENIVPFLSVILGIILLSIILILVYHNREKFGKIIDQLALPAIAIGCLLHILSYKATGYLHAKYWYWISETALVFMLASIIFSIAVEDAFQRFTRKKTANLIYGLALAFPVVLFSHSILRDFPVDGYVNRLYDLNSETIFIENETIPGDVIGMTGGGLLGYFIPDRTFVNLDGLINSSEYFEKMKSNESHEYLGRIGIRYIYGEEAVLLDSDPYRWMFTGKLKFINKGPFFWLYRYCSEGCAEK